MQEVRIPGKVMLSGEYAVLHGAPAVLLPVDRQLIVMKAERAPRDGYAPAVAAARALPIPALADHEAEAGVPHVAIDRSEFLAADAAGRSLKLGIGLSAAEAAGVIALRYECAGVPWLMHWRAVAQLAIGAHREAQGGQGSGADVAACALGKPLRFEASGERFLIEPLGPPPAARWIPLNLAWTGRPADTRRLVERFELWSCREEAADPLRRLCAAAGQLADAWFTADQQELFHALDDFHETLIACTTSAGVEYQLPAHTRLAAWARRHGGRAKPTGAGGGDMVLLIGDLPLEQLGELLILPLERMAK